MDEHLLKTQVTRERLVVAREQVQVARERGHIQRVLQRVRHRELKLALLSKSDHSSF